MDRMPLQTLFQLHASLMVHSLIGFRRPASGGRIKGKRSCCQCRQGIYCLFRAASSLYKLINTLPSGVEFTVRALFVFESLDLTEALIIKCLKFMKKTAIMILEKPIPDAYMPTAMNWLAPAYKIRDVITPSIAVTPAVFANIPKVIAIGKYPAITGNASLNPRFIIKPPLLKSNM